MTGNDFFYGSFKPYKGETDLNSQEKWCGEFRPVVLSKGQKRKLLKMARKAEAFQKNISSAEFDKSSGIPCERVRHSIGQKLIFIISTIVILALGGVTYLVSHFVTADTRTNAEENNLTINSRSADDCENRFTNIVSSVGMFLDLLKNSGDSEASQRSSANLFFSRSNDVVAVVLPSTGRKFTSRTFFLSNEIQESSVDDYVSSSHENVVQAEAGDFIVENACPFFNKPLISFFYSVDNGTEDKSVCVLYSAEALWESFASGNVNLSILVNGKGTVLVSPDFNATIEAKDLSQYPIVKTMLSSTENNTQTTFNDENDEEYIGAFHKLSKGNCGVVTVVKTAVILEAVNATTRRNIYLTVAILSVVILFVYFFSKSMSVPLKQLTAVVNEINQGNFNTELFNDLKVKHHDEISVLIKSTKNEREILNTFTKLTNKGVTRAIIRKEIDFEPHLKDITIFFSDIRGFTAISDGFKKRFGEHSAAEIIKFLNDYMSRMVTCITRTGGTVDKFEGDAIMACWGVLRQESLDWEKLPDGSEEKQTAKERHEDYVREDALNAIRASLAMRYSLMRYNKEAMKFTRLHENDEKSSFKPLIKAGRGLNSGRATVGFMGSYEKMEFTSIGDAVNFASRTEASNKPCGTDMLITEDTYNILKLKYIRCPENNFKLLPENEKDEIVVEKIPVEFEVKGKGKQHFYGVVNMPRFDIQEFFEPTEPCFVVDSDCARCLGPSGPVSLDDVRELLMIQKPDFSKVNLDEEENKIKVASK